MDAVTIKDIARELRLSRNTVANALSGKNRVAVETRNRIIQKAAEMGYKKLSSEISASIDGQEANTVMILTRTDVSLFWNNVIAGISEELAMRGQSATIQFANEEKEEYWNTQSVGGHKLTGILALSVYSDRFLRRYLDLNVPMVFMDTGISDSSRAFFRGDVIMSEGFYAVESLTRHLVAQGMRHIGFIGDISFCRTIRDRYEGFLQGLESAGIEPDCAIIATKRQTHRYYQKYEVEEALNAFGYMPEAVVCANDDIALHLITCLNDREIRVPDDVAVTGYDNLEALIKQLPPFLSTVNVRHIEMGKRLVRQLMWRRKNPYAPKEIIMVRGDVIIRSSSAKHPNSGGESNIKTEE